LTTTSRSNWHPMMACGHAANAVCSAKGGIKYEPAIPSCAICSCIEVSLEQPDLTGRIATCCGETSWKPSSFQLAFFEYRGPGSKVALTTCKHCHYSEFAHTNKAKQTERGRKNNNICDSYLPNGPWEMDRYYCGCRGWD